MASAGINGRANQRSGISGARAEHGGSQSQFSSSQFSVLTRVTPRPGCQTTCDRRAATAIDPARAATDPRALGRRRPASAATRHTCTYPSDRGPRWSQLGATSARRAALFKLAGALGGPARRIAIHACVKDDRMGRAFFVLRARGHRGGGSSLPPPPPQPASFHTVSSAYCSSVCHGAAQALALTQRTLPRQRTRR